MDPPAFLYDLFRLIYLLDWFESFLFIEFFAFRSGKIILKYLLVKHIRLLLLDFCLFFF